jgi:hypothetical protein
MVADWIRQHVITTSYLSVMFVIATMVHVLT